MGTPQLQHQVIHVLCLILLQVNIIKVVQNAPGLFQIRIVLIKNVKLVQMVNIQMMGKQNVLIVIVRKINAIKQQEYVLSQKVAKKDIFKTKIQRNVLMNVNMIQAHKHAKKQYYLMLV